MDIKARQSARAKLSIPEHPKKNFSLYTSNGTLIATGYTRVVIGDRGAYIEFSKKQAIIDNMTTPPDQKWRWKDKNWTDKVYYWWLTAKDSSGIKIYFQRKLVDYADYKADMFYVSPTDVKVETDSAGCSIE
jgi:hypothetical protein